MTFNPDIDSQSDICVDKDSTRRRFLRSLAGTAVCVTGALSLGASPAHKAAPKSATAIQPAPSASSISVMDFGAKADGKTDDTAAIVKAIAAAPTRGRVVYFPPGNYLVSQTLTLDSPITLIGGGEICTLLTMLSPTGDLIVANSAGVEIRHLQFVSGVKRTSGAYVNFAPPSHHSCLDHFCMAGSFVGVNIASVSTTVEHGSIMESATGDGSCAISVTGGDDVHIINILTANAPANKSFAGIWVNSNGAVQLTDCDICNSGRDLYLTKAYSVYATNTFFDTADYGIYIDSNSEVVRCHFIGCWTCSHANDGVFINTPSTPGAGVGDIDFIGHHSMLNKRNGFNVEGTNIQIANSNIAQNGGDGIVMGATASRCRIANNMIGQTGRLVGNTNGLVLTDGCSLNMITGNYISGNTKAQVTGKGTGNMLQTNMGVDA